MCKSFCFHGMSCLQRCKLTYVKKGAQKGGLYQAFQVNIMWSLGKIPCIFKNIV
jgi:hypothetical protein